MSMQRSIQSVASSSRNLRGNLFSESVYIVINLFDVVISSRNRDAIKNALKKVSDKEFGRKLEHSKNSN